MIILGLNAFHADFSAALAARRQADCCRGGGAIPSYKALGGISFAGDRLLLAVKQAFRLSDVDHIAFNQDSRANLMRKIGYFLTNRPNINLVLRRLRNRRARAGIPSSSRASLPRRNHPRGTPPGRASFGASILSISCLPL